MHTGTLPKSKQAIAEAMRLHAERERQKLGFRQLMWTLSFWYLQGVRRFTAINPTGGTIVPNMLDDDGNLPFMLHELLVWIDRASSALASSDYRPQVSRPGSSLTLFRQRASAQALADSLINPTSLSEAVMLWSFMLSQLGSCGVTIHLSNTPRGVTGDVEVIHPKELMPWPSLGRDLSRKSGMMREGVVTIDDLVRVIGSGVKKKLEDIK